MIVGVSLRAIKTYQKIEIIPLSTGQRFCGILGRNGAGKSTILEALDVYFNGGDYNISISVKKSGTTSVIPFVCPICVIPKTKLNLTPEQVSVLEKMSSALRNNIVNYTISRNKKIAESFQKVLDNLIDEIDFEEHYLVISGEDFNNEFSLGPLGTRKFVEYITSDVIVDGDSELANAEDLSCLSWIGDKVTEYFDYIYIPAEVLEGTFANLGSRQVYALIGEEMQKVLSGLITKGVVRDINSKLDGFSATLNGAIQPYAFRQPQQRQTKIKQAYFHNLAKQAFFDVRNLHKKVGESWLSINSLSSGEQQRALIFLLTSLTTAYTKTRNRLIIAVDEPEQSLHISACYSQFSDLLAASTQFGQLLFATHWYGFIPAASEGFVLSINSEGDTNRDFVWFDLYSGREKIVQLVRRSKHSAAIDLGIKSTHDFVESIISNCMSDDAYTWIICEGSTDKVYLECMLLPLLEDKSKIRVCPVGGAKEVRRIHDYIKHPFEVLKNDIKGLVITLIDTDAESIEFHSSHSSRLLDLRIVYDETKNDVVLVKASNNKNAPITVIEQALSSKTYKKTLEFLNMNGEMFQKVHFNLAESINDAAKISYNSYDLKTSQPVIILEVLKDHRVKKAFSLKYSELYKDDIAPEWISELVKIID